MWDLNWVVVAGPQPEKPSNDIARLLSAGPRPFRGRASAEEREDLQRLLVEGWEPFGTEVLANGNFVFVFRRLATADIPVLGAEDLPGQYL